MQGVDLEQGGEDAAEGGDDGDGGVALQVGVDGGHLAEDVVGQHLQPLDVLGQAGPRPRGQVPVAGQQQVGQRLAVLHRVVVQHRQEGVVLDQQDLLQQPRVAARLLEQPHRGVLVGAAREVVEQGLAGLSAPDQEVLCQLACFFLQ
jgi:hypothetical protein